MNGLYGTSGFTMSTVKLTSEEQGEDDDELVHSVTQNVLHHGPGDERLVTAVRFT